VLSLVVPNYLPVLLNQLTELLIMNLAKEKTLEFYTIPSGGRPTYLSNVYSLSALK